MLIAHNCNIRVLQGRLYLFSLEDYKTHSWSDERFPECEDSFKTDFDTLVLQPCRGLDIVCGLHY